ncbi:MAG: peroxiredoxin family protein [Pirellula sp.]
MIILTNDTWNPNAFRQWIVSFAVLFLATGVIGCDWGSKEKQVSAPANPNANGEKPASGTDGTSNPDGSKTQKDVTKETSGEANKIPTEGKGEISPSAPSEVVSVVADSEDLQKKAKQLIVSCIEHYRDLKSYEDAAVFKLKVPYPTNPVNELIPCRVAWEKPNKLALEVELLKSSWTPETFESVYEDGKSTLHPNQRLVRPLPENVTSDWLLRDHLEQQLINPMFGLPLNIGFLLDESGSKAFLNEVTTRWLSPAEIDGVKCERIQVNLQEVSWVYWIDEPNRLLLRQEFPHAVLRGVLPPIPSTIAASDVVCQIDYLGVKTNERIDWAPWAIKPRETDLQLRRFIATPARDVPRQLGSRVEPFSLKDVDGKIFFDFAERKSTVTSFHFVDDTEASRSYIDELYVVRRQLKDRGVGDEYETILVSNRPADRMAAVMASWNCTLPLAIDTDGLLMKSWGVEETPATVVVGTDNRIQHFSQQRLPLGMVSDVPSLAKGGDLATQAIKNAVDNEARYSALLHRFALARDELKKLPADYQEIASFPFFFHEMKQDWKISFEDGFVAAVGEMFSAGLDKPVVDPAEIYGVGYPSTRVMTVLDDVGNLWSIDQRGNRTIVATLPVESTENAKRFWIYPDPWKHEIIYIVPEGLSRFWFAVAPRTVPPNWKPLKVDEFPLSADETIVNASWVLADSQPAFCLMTSSSRVIAINPTTQASEVPVDNSKQKAAINSIVPKLNSKSSPDAWALVRADGSIEYIESKVPASDLAKPQSLLFKPEVGPWLWGSSPVGPRLVGLARIPSGESAAVVLDESFKSLSTQSLATRPEQCRLLSSISSKTGAFYFLLTAPNRVLHLQTIGGKAPDQMSFGRRIFGGSINALDDGVRIVVAMDGEVSSWTVTYKE